MSPTFPSSPHHANANTRGSINSNASSAASGPGGNTSNMNTGNVASHHSHYQYPGDYHPQTFLQQQQQQQAYGSRHGVSWSSLPSSTGHVGIPMDDDLQPMHDSIASLGQQQYQHQRPGMQYHHPHQHQHLQQQRQTTAKDSEWGSISPSASGPTGATLPYQAYAGMTDKRSGHVMVPATSFQPLSTMDHVHSSPTVSASQTFLIPPPPSLQANSMYYHDHQHQQQQPPPPQLDSQSPRNVQQHQRNSYIRPYPDLPSSSYNVDESTSTSAVPTQVGSYRIGNSQGTDSPQPNNTKGYSGDNTRTSASTLKTANDEAGTKEVVPGETIKSLSGDAPPPPIAPESSSSPLSSTIPVSVGGSGSSSSSSLSSGSNNNVTSTPTSVSPRTGVPLVSGRHPVVGVMGLAPSTSSPSRSPVSPVLLQKSSSLRSTRPSGGSSLKENTFSATNAAAAATGTTSTSTPTLASSALPKGDAVSASSTPPHGSSSLSSATTGIALSAAGGAASGKGGGAGAGSTAPMATTIGASGHGGSGVSGGADGPSVFSPSSPSIQGVGSTTNFTTSAHSPTVAPPAPSHHSPSLNNTMSHPTNQPTHTPRHSSSSYHHHRASYQPTQFAQGYQHFASSQGTSSGYLSTGPGLSRHLSIHLPTNPTLLPPPPAVRTGNQQQPQQQLQGHHSAYTIDDAETVSSSGHPRSFTPPALSSASKGMVASPLQANDTKQGLGRNGSVGTGGHSAYSIPSSAFSPEGGYVPSSASGYSGISMPLGGNTTSSTSQRYSQASPAQRQHTMAQTKQQHHQSYIPPPVSYQYLSAFGPSYKHAAASSGYHNLPRTHRRSIQPLTLEQQQPKGGAFRYVRTQADLWPQKGSQKYRSIDAHGHSISPLRALTTLLTRTYSHCSKDFCYEPSYNPRRVLTKPSKPMHNEGYDNEDYDYILYVGDILGSEERQRYQILDILGQGTFGQVVKCQNLKTNAIVAVKVVKNKPAYFNQSMMEVTVLELLNERYDREDRHHILRLLDTFIHRRHLCLVFELLSVNLYELIKQNQFRGLSMSLVRVFTAQLLDALCVLNEARIIHCDLKPENVLLKNLETPAIKVIDFGSACHEQQTVYTYIQSRFYRSPEVLIGLPYSSSIDIWSVGCIAAELFLGLPLFPGSSEYNQVLRIVEMLGMPPTYMLEIGKTAREYFEVVRQGPGNGGGSQKKYRLKSMEQYSREHRVIEQPSKRYFQATTLPEIIMSYPLMKKNMSQREIDKEMATRQSFVNFLQGLLNLNPIERWSPQQAKMHPFITGEVFSGRFVPPSIPKKVITAENSARLEPTMPQNSHAARRASLSNANASMTYGHSVGLTTTSKPPTGPSAASSAAVASSSQQSSSSHVRGNTAGQADNGIRQGLGATESPRSGQGMSESSSESSLGSILTSTPSSDTYGVGSSSTGAGPHSALSSTATAVTQNNEASLPSVGRSGHVETSSRTAPKSHATESSSTPRSRTEEEEECDDRQSDEAGSTDILGDDAQDDQGSESRSSSDSVADEMEELSISKQPHKDVERDIPPRAGRVRIQDDGERKHSKEENDGAGGEETLDRLAQNIGWDDFISGSGSASTSGSTSYSQHRPRATTMGTVEVPRTMAQLAAAITPLVGAKGVGSVGPAVAGESTIEGRTGVPSSTSKTVQGPLHSGGGHRVSTGRGSGAQAALSETTIESSASGARNATMPSPMSPGTTMSAGLDRIPEHSENPSPVHDQNPSRTTESSTTSLNAATSSSTNARGPSSHHSGPAVGRRGFLVRSGSDITGILSLINSPGSMGGANIRNRVDGSEGRVPAAAARSRAAEAESGSVSTQPPPPQDNLTPLQRMQQQLRQSQLASTQQQRQKRYHFGYPQSGSSHSGLSSSDDDDDEDDNDEEDDEDDGDNEKEGEDNGDVDEEEEGDERDGGGQDEEMEVVVSVHDDEHRDRGVNRV
ncbi:dual specificity protein kinase yak1 [Actinomortierella wolfii]|nr:dual specificity protein kinase yak1 [Actinomortierella wolfii]